MAKLFNGKILFASALQPSGAQPLDDRSVVQSFNDLINSDTFVVNGASAAYNGMIVSVLDEQKSYMLVNKEDITNKNSWIAVGSGNGSIAVETYAEAIAMATSDNIGQVIYVKNESEYDADGEEGEGVAVKYDAAPYIVIGAGELMKLAASTASGDINSEVAGLKTRVSELEGEIDTKVSQSEYDTKVSEIEGEIGAKVSQTDYDTKVSELEGEIGAKVSQSDYDTKVSELEGEIGAKVSQSDYDTKVSEIEGEIETISNKLSTIDEGAQVNVIEKVKVNGVELTVADSDKSIDIEIPSAPVQGVVNKEGQILTLSNDGKLDTTLTLEYVKATETENPILRLKGVDDFVVSSIDATDFIKDGMIESVKLEGPSETETGTKYLVITWNTESGKDVTRLDVSELFNPYTASNGVQLNEGNFSIKLATNEQYLEVTTDGLKTTQTLWDKVTELDNTNLDAAKKYTDAEIKKVTDAQTLVDNAQNDRLTAIEEKSSIWDSAEQNAKDYADGKFVTKEGFNEFETEYEEKLNNIAEGAQVNVIESVSVNGINATIEDKNASIEIKATDIEIGTTITDGETNIHESNAKLSTVLQSIQDSITIAQAGSYTGVVAGNGINAELTASKTQHTISVKVAETEGNLISVDGNGLYAAMYYDGDDAE